MENTQKTEGKTSTENITEMQLNGFYASCLLESEDLYYEDEDN